MTQEPVLDEPRIALKVRAVSKTFPGVRALSDFDLDVQAGSVHALLGHNGCGKSTLVKALAGVHAPDPGGEAWIDGQRLVLGDPKDAVRKGLRFVHQELGIVPQLGAVDNVGFVLGYERDGLRRINWRRQAKRTVELLAEFGFQLDPWQPLGEASPPQRAAVAIVRAVAGWQRGRGVLILDEPTAALPKHEVDQLFKLIRDISGTGTAVILVSHRLDEVIAIADHATVMRAGETIWNGSLKDTTMAGLVRLIADTPEEAGGAAGPDPEVPATPDAGVPVAPDAGVPATPESGVLAPSAGAAAASGPLALEIRNLHSRYLHGIDITVRKGEVLGVAGLLGSGREELPYIVAGDLRNGVSGTFTQDGTVHTELTIRVTQAAGVSLVPADRATEGIFSDFTTGENVSIAGLHGLRQTGIVAPRNELGFARSWLESMHADTDAVRRHISTLSGGNQQKAVLARSLSVKPKLLVLSEPTAGVDIGTRLVLYDQIRQRAREGLGVLMASSDVEDLMAACDRVVVLRDGVIAGAFAGAEMSKPSILDAMEGVSNEQRA